MTTVDPAFNTLNYEEQGGARLVIGGEIDIVTGGKLKINGVDVTSGAGGSNVAGVAAGYKVARGVHQQAAASDTIVTGLTTVVAVVVSWRDKPTLKQLYVAASIGDQAGAPAAGSILINTYKATAANDCTPGTPTDFTDNLSIDWVAVGT